jgi:hypothetical protein
LEGFTVSEKQRQSAFKNKVLRRIFNYERRSNMMDKNYIIRHVIIPTLQKIAFG